MSVIRWKFRDTVTDETVTLPLNPNTMSTPTTPRNMSWAWGTKAGHNRLRGIDAPPQSPNQWSFGGVIQTKEHYDLLLDWAGRLVVLEVTDHLERTFVIMIINFAPVERLPTAIKPWRATYTMTCMLLEA